MCLLFKTPANLEIAEEDITVYKSLVMSVEDGKVIYKPPFQSHFTYVLGVEYSLNKPIKLESRWDNYPIDFKRTDSSVLDAKVEEAFHSFVEESGARAITDSKYFGNSVARCTIPKGSTYIVGVFANAHSIASDRIIINEII